MKVGYFTASISRQGSGLAESVRREARALHESGAEVEVFAVEDADSASDLAPWQPLTVHLTPGLGPSRFSYAPGLSPALAKAKLDVLSTHGLWRYTSMAASRWHAETQRPYVVSPHGMLDPWALQNSRLRKRAAGLLFEDRHLHRASCLRALCDAEANAIREYGLRNPIAIIPNGVPEPNLGSAIPPPWSEIEGFANSKILFSLGRLHPKKNLIALLMAWRQLRSANVKGIDEWRLVIAGWDEGGYGAELKEYATESELSRQVWFPGPLFGAQKEAAYRAASGFVIPSLSEGLPMVVLEAWSYALPVLMTPQCNLPEGFKAGAAIALNESPDSIAKGIRQLLALNEGERVTMGLRGAGLCAEHFNWARIAQQMADLLRWISGKGERPATVID